MARKKYRRVDQHELCRLVSNSVNVSQEDVEMILKALVVHIKDNLCMATETTDSWVKVTDDIAFKAEYVPEKKYKGHVTPETIVPSLRISDLEEQILADEYKRTQLYARILEESEQK